MSGGLDDATRCANCGAALTGTYCSACGQRRARPLQVGRLFGEGFAEVVSLDNAWWTTLREMTLRPGAMVRRYVAGERKRFVNPILYMVTTATALLATLHLLEIDLGTLQVVGASQRAGFELLLNSFGYLAVLVALPLAWLMRAVLRRGEVGEYYVLLVYAYGQLALLQVVLYVLGAGSDPALFMASRFASALFFGWVFAGYFGRRRVLAAFGGVLAYVLMLASFILAGSVMLTLLAVWQRLGG